MTFPIVAIGASGGGLETITELLGALPAKRCTVVIDALAKIVKLQCRVHGVSCIAIVELGGTAGVRRRRTASEPIRLVFRQASGCANHGAKRSERQLLMAPNYPVGRREPGEGSSGQAQPPPRRPRRHPRE